MYSVKEVCVALFPYEAVNSDELTLVEGDIVTILSHEVEDKGWWRGELKGKIGVFPDNFVQLLNQDEVITIVFCTLVKLIFNLHACFIIDSVGT